MSGKDTVEYEEKLLEGKVLLFSRSGVFQVRLYKGDRRYIYRSLKTRDLKAAREEAVRAYYEVEFRKREQLPLQSKRFADVLNEYVLFRRRQNQRGTHKQSNKRNQQQTSDEMLRQVERVTKFWLEYAGNRLIERVDNSVLRDYVAWRQNYYLRVPAAKRPRNHSINPADKTLEWETTYAITVLKWATERGYRGNLPVPKFRHTADRTKTRPAFSLKEYRVLVRAMRRWIWDAKGKTDAQRYTREMVRDYVLILANSGMRVGEANNLRETDLEVIRDDTGRELYGFNVDGKTGKRFLVLRANAKRYVERVLARNAVWRERWALDKENTASAANTKKPAGNWLFRMSDGSKVLSLIDQFNKVLELGGIRRSASGELYSLYCLRHFYAVQMLRSGRVGVFDIARNMGTSVQIIEAYYGKHATPQVLATRLGG
jgi:integrase